MRRRIIAALLTLTTLALLVWWYISEVRLHADCENCAENLHELGYAMSLYARAHDGKWPDSLAELMRASGNLPIVFVCPASDETPAEGPDETTRAKNLTAGGHLSYVYLGNGLIEPVAESDHVVVAYDRQVFHGRLGLNVLFADGHVETLPPAQAKRFLASTPAATRPIRWSASQ